MAAIVTSSGAVYLRWKSVQNGHFERIVWGSQLPDGAAATHPCLVPSREEIARWKASYAGYSQARLFNTALQQAGDLNWCLRVAQEGILDSGGGQTVLFAADKASFRSTLPKQFVSTRSESLAGASAMRIAEIQPDDYPELWAAAREIEWIRSEASKMQ